MRGKGGVINDEGSNSLLEISEMFPAVGTWKTSQMWRMQCIQHGTRYLKMLPNLSGKLVFAGPFLVTNQWAIV